MTSTSPSSGQTTFPRFLDLPLEVRLKVYEFTLAGTGILFPRDHAESDSIIFQGTALLHSSKKIKNEALPVFYGVNQFPFSHAGRRTEIYDKFE